MAETPVHRDNMINTLFSLDHWYASEEEVYVSANMFVYFVEGKPWYGLAPDTFVVRGVPRREREVYKTWEEPKRTLDFVAEFTSRSTKEDDQVHKFNVYQDDLRVKEYLLLDPYEEYLNPPEQLYRRVRGKFQRVRPLNGRLPSKVLGLHLEREGKFLRLWNPGSRIWLPTPDEETAQRKKLEAENERLRRELERLRRGNHSKP